MVSFRNQTALATSAPSFLLSKRFDFIDKLLDSEKVELVFCDELIAELIEIIDRPRLRNYFTIENIALIFEIIDCHAVYIPVVSSVTLCRDAKDNFLLSLAKDARADYLLTGDKDLLVLKAFDGTQIVTIKEFQTIISENITL